MACGRSRHTKTVGLSGDSITDREISKYLVCSTAGESGRVPVSRDLAVRQVQLGHELPFLRPPAVKREEFFENFQWGDNTLSPP